MPTDKPSISALVKLIDDPDESVFSQVRDELIKCGSMAIPYLEKSWEEITMALYFKVE
jgi:hypothetical protein